MTGTREQHELIKMRLRLAGSSLACIARELGIQPTTVTATSQARDPVAMRLAELRMQELCADPAEQYLLARNYRG